MKQLILVFLLVLSHQLCSQNLVKGHLSNEQKSAVISELERINSIVIDSSKTIVVNFFLKPEKFTTCIDHYTSDKAYVKSFRKSRAVQFFITEKNYAYKKAKVKQDKSNLIKQLLFKDAEQCGNYIIIWPDGETLTQLGEYTQRRIMEIISGK